MDSAELRQRAFSNNYFNLILLPTEACNFRCTYCYETFAHGKMSPGVVRGVEALLDTRAPELDRLDISWFGGEPLLARDIVFAICGHAQKLSREHGFRFTSSITTNGYFLDSACFASCLDRGIDQFQVSLDGDTATHDATRKLISERGTFQRIYTNLLRIKDGAGLFEIVLRLHYTRENFTAIADFGRQLHAEFGGDSRFRYYFKAVEPLGGPHDAKIAHLSMHEKREIEQYLWRHSGLPDGKIVDADTVCYAALGNSLVVRSTGRLAKCTVAFADDFNDIGVLNEDGTISVAQEKFRWWIAPILEERWDDAGCPLASVAAKALAVRGEAREAHPPRRSSVPKGAWRS
jgi:uncharacterized protein